MHFFFNVEREIQEILILIKDTVGYLRHVCLLLYKYTKHISEDPNFVTDNENTRFSQLIAHLAAGLFIRADFLCIIYPLFV